MSSGLDGVVERLRSFSGRFGAFLEKVCSELAHFFDWAGVYWLRGGMIELVAYRGVYGLKMRLEVGEGVVGKVVKEGKPQTVKTLGDLFGGMREGVCVAVPVKIDGRVVGVLGVGLENGEGVFEDVLDVLCGVCEDISRRYRAASG